MGQNCFHFADRDTLDAFRVREGPYLPLHNGTLQGVLAHTDVAGGYRRRVSTSKGFFPRGRPIWHAGGRLEATLWQQRRPILVFGLDRLERDLIGSVGIAILESNPERFAHRDRYTENGKSA